ncbi:uncharacterized protein LOC143559876 [Bidens hawaiensis]|uniref:uncharacterized protein LOC143559876 n=1 Tax=Bidens hawaiensis TaxID=980011 RepID=UPI00404ADFF9
MSSPPPPSNPTADYLTSVARGKHSHHPSIFYNSPLHQHHHHQQQPPAATGVKGFIPRPNSDHNLPNFGGYPYRRLLNSDQFINPHLQPAVGPTTASSANHTKVAGQSSVVADNSLKNKRDTNGDDSFVNIRDRKVQVSEGTSLYAQCRSWLKNGLILEKQPQYVDHVKPLPKPLPAAIVEPRNDNDMEAEEKTEDVEHLSAKELLQQHVKHAKRLRIQRLQRIERYKDRLALLLPPVVDQHPKTDPIA